MENNATFSKSFELGRMDIVDLFEWFTSGKLNYNTYFQRQAVWRKSDRVELIDTIMNGYPIPSIFLCEASTDFATLKKNYNVLDGRQRLESIFDFLQNKYRYNNKLFIDFTDDEKTTFVSYSIPVIQLYVKPNETDKIKKIFSKLNKNSYTLNKIEKTSSQFVEFKFMTLCKILTGNIEFENIDNYLIEMSALFNDEEVDTSNEIIIDEADNPTIPDDIKKIATNDNIQYIKLNLTSNNLFYSPYQMQRQVPLQHIMNILSSILENEPIYRNITEKNIEKYSELEFDPLNDIISKLNFSNKIIYHVCFNDDINPFWKNVTCYYSLSLLFYDKISYFTEIPPKEIISCLNSFSQSESDDFKAFQRFSQERSNDKQTRIARHKILEELFLANFPLDK